MKFLIISDILFLIEVNTMTDIRKALADNLNELIKTKNIKSVELAEKVGVSKSAVSHWLAGDNSPNIEVLAKICQIYGVRLSEMLNEKVEISYAERKILEKYRILDQYGKELIDIILNYECKRCSETQQKTPIQLVTPSRNAEASRSYLDIYKKKNESDVDEQKLIDAPENDIDM